MNARDKEVLKALNDQLSTVRLKIEEMRDEKQTDFDELEEKQQEGEKGEALETAISALEEAISNIDSAEADLEELLS